MALVGERAGVVTARQAGVNRCYVPINYSDSKLTKNVHACRKMPAHYISFIRTSGKPLLAFTGPQAAANDIAQRHPTHANPAPMTYPMRRHARARHGHPRSCPLAAPSIGVDPRADSPTRQTAPKCLNAPRPRHPGRRRHAAREHPHSRRRPPASFAEADDLRRLGRGQRRQLQRFGVEIELRHVDHLQRLVVVGLHIIFAVLDVGDG